MTRQIFIHFSTLQGETFQQTFTLSGTIDPAQSKSKLTKLKLELYLRKKNFIWWNSLENKEEPNAQSSAMEYPSSAKAKHNWEQIGHDMGKEEDDTPANPDEFFKKLYANANDETRRAMMKSFVQSVNFKHLPVSLFVG